MSGRQIASSAVIHPGVVLPEDIVVEDFCILGAPAGAAAPTVFGNGAHLRSHTVVYAGNTIGRGFRTGNKANIREHNQIGDDVSIGTLSVVEHHVIIGSRVRIHTQAFIPEFTVIEDDAWLGPNVVFTNALYPAAADTKDKLAGARLCRGCKIGANVTVLPGLTIGAGALIGAGSLVTKDVPPDALAYGHPAQVHGTVSSLASYRDLRRQD
jgi:acetyltransferase-like isoleucine patch superfamily enzyme